MKEISRAYFNAALCVLQRNYETRMINIYVMETNPVKLGVNMAATGTVTSDRALELAQKLAAAAKACDEFPFNGYKVIDNDDE